ncbi:hypothetical protein [Acrocarpospora sp. B8E8]|uniref:hypothetical protein n=1 Tax=Acrocarpospora sp. B8E8 TaxID=3153572 RepID=UPI00325C90E2
MHEDIAGYGDLDKMTCNWTGPSPTGRRAAALPARRRDSVDGGSRPVTWGAGWNPIDQGLLQRNQ